MINNSLRLTWLEIDSKALNHNIKQVKDKLKPETDIMAIVKANAYGHGIEKIAKRVIKAGVQYLGVATINEGIILRKAGIKSPILILGTILKKQFEAIIEYDLIANVYNYKIAKEINQLGKEVDIHIKIDTGMGRIGVLASNASSEIKKIASLNNINIRGLFSHFAAADGDKGYTLRQLKLFNEIVTELEDVNLEIDKKHIANSAAIINYPASHYNLVRMGIILYGLYPSPELRKKLDLKPVLSWKARIVNLKELSPGNSISYGCTYTTDKVTEVATLPVGYHDGYFRLLSDKAEVICQGQRCPVIGRVCMDQIMVDVTGVGAKKGDIVTLIGKSGDEEITAQQLADLVGTINYEIVSRIGERVPRIYV